MPPDIKILLVSDVTKFALTDVFHGYEYALSQLKIPFEAFPWHHLRTLIADDICFHIMHSQALIKSKGFSHIMFIGGLSTAPFILESLYHVKSIVISTEDPHSWDPMKQRLSFIDYYFSNERSIPASGRFKNVYYCPTAGSTHECGRIPVQNIDDKYKSDILFLGAVYPNRQKILEAIIPFVEENHLSFKICGHAQYMPKSSPLWKYAFDVRTIPHQETVKYYNGTKVCLNILRDVHWNPRTKSKKNPYNRGRFPAESLNPRAYEVPLCQTFMLLEDTRPEAREIFTENEVGFFSDEETLTKALGYYLLGEGSQKREEMAFNAYKKVAEKHTYVHRMIDILKVISAQQ